MAELDVKKLFQHVCGSNCLVERTDVEQGRLDRNMAKALGIIDENGNYTNNMYSLEDFESVDGIDDLLNRVRNKKSKAVEHQSKSKTKRVNENGSKVVSQEKCTYKNGVEGTLIRYADGSLEFIDVTEEHKRQGLSVKFKNEEDYKAGRPYKIVAKSVQQDANGNPVKDKNGMFIPETLITDIEYTADGKVKNKMTKNDKGTVLLSLKNDDDGLLISEKKYTSDGKLISSREASWQDEKTRVVLLKNGNGEIQEKKVTVMNGKKPVFMTVYNKDGGKKSEIAFNEDGKKTNMKVYYKDGKTVKSEIEYFPETGGYKNRKIYNKEGQLEHEYTADMIPDGKTWDKISAQGTGDCYLLSSINAIRELDNGDKLLSDLIEIKADENGKKTYTVTLPGAKIAADSLRKDGLKVAITGTYTFTEEEFEKIAKKQGVSYSLGNANIILLEAAFEKYRQEVAKTAKDNNITINQDTLGIAGLEGASGKLDGGLCFDATFVLTGKNSETYLVANTGRGLDKEALERGEALIISNYSSDMVDAGVSSIDGGEYTSDQEEMNKMLDEVMNDMNDGKKDVIATASFKIYVNGKQAGGHAFTIKEVTEDTVTIINPWYPEETITLSRSEFVKTTTQVTVSDTTKATRLTEQTIVPNNKSHKQEHKKDEPTPERPVTEEEKKQLNSLIKRFFGGGSPEKPSRPSKNSRSMKILEKAITGDKSKNSKRNEGTLTPTQEEQTKKQVSNLVKRMGKK